MEQKEWKINTYWRKTVWITANAITIFIILLIIGYIIGEIIRI